MTDTRDFCMFIKSPFPVNFNLGKGSKIKLIIFAEFSAKGGTPPPTPPSRKIINFFSKLFLLA